MDKKMKVLDRVKNKSKKEISLKDLIWVSFTLASLIAAAIMGGALYSIFSSQIQQQVAEERELTMTQINASVVSHLRNMMKISDALYYNVIKDEDIQKNDFSSDFQLLYDSNNAYIKNIALFSEEGEEITLAPAAIVKENVNPADQKWFQEALKQSENLHFYPPHVQNLFQEMDHKYEWVITLSRAVLITDGIEIKRGVLLVDLKYSGVEQILRNASVGKNGYIYITDNSGELVYHPEKQFLTEEQKLACASLVENKQKGDYEASFHENVQSISTKIIGYTGWTMTGITTQDSFNLGTVKGRLVALCTVMFFATALILLNSYVSKRVSKPFEKLEGSLKKIEAGNMDVVIDVTGAYEVRHLGKTIQKMTNQIKKLMADIVMEHEAKRKSELDSLQAQINPHFLYNTLDIVVWMIENERQQDASRVVTALARFFRISLSKGHRIISVKNEIEHVENYLVIQKMRYKNRFEFTIKADEDVRELATIKLVLQPLVENAIYHGMEFMDGDGEIHIRAYRDDKQLLLSVRDNGLGMTPEKVQTLLNGEVKPTGKGSGTGVGNVNQRVQLYFGKEYGLEIISEPDEGTEMLIHLPIVAYEDMREDRDR